jgi:hypothetical protein
MKKILLCFVLLVSSVICSYSQILIDEGPIVDPNFIHLRYSLSGTSWSSLSLKYYIYNTSDHLTSGQRENIIQTAFQTWAAVSALSFTQVFDPSQAQLKIKWVKGAHGDGHPFDGLGGILAHAAYPPPLGGAIAGEIHFDDDEPWTIDNSGRNLLSVAIHEIGHALGLGHSSVTNAIMYPYYTGITSLSYDDISAICDLYYPPISGPNSISCDDAATYSFSLQGNWIVDFPLGIMNGDGSNSVVIRRSSGNNTVMTCTISVGTSKGTVSKEISVPVCIKDGNDTIFSMSSVYPNPANNVLYVDIEKKNIFKTAINISNAKQVKDYTILLYNMSGVLQKEVKSADSGVSIDMSNIKSGIYFLYIYKIGKTKPETHKIIVKH